MRKLCQLPSDVVSVTMHLDNVYTGVGGDKFGAHWCLEDVAVICQHHQLGGAVEVNAFRDAQVNKWEFSSEYDSCAAGWN